MNISELVVCEWINSAQEDLDAITLTSQVPLLAHTCYHCGQAIEKILKAYIIAKESRLIKTHDIEDLLGKCQNHSSDFGKFEYICEDLTKYVTVRYPPIENVPEQKMELAIKNTHEIVDFTMEKLKQLGYNPTKQPTSENIKKMIEAVNTSQKQKVIGDNIETYIAKGKAEGILQTARAMKAEGIDPNTISKITNLTVDDILRL